MNLLVAYPLLLHTKVIHGSGMRMLRLLHTLAGQGHTIHLLCLAEMDADPYEPDIQPLRAICREVRIFRRTMLTRWGKARSFLTPGVPPHQRNVVIPEAMRYVQELTGSGQIDAAYFTFTVMGEYARAADRSRCKVVIDADDLETRHYRLKLQAPLRLRVRAHSWLTSLRAAAYERELLSKADLTVAISEQEKQFILDLAPTARVEVIPLMLDIRDFQSVSPDAEPDTVLFFGSFGHHSNVDAATWLCHSILPDILKAHPNARLLIVGRYSRERIGALASAHVQVVGEVEDMRDWLAKAAVVVSPIRTGGGARVKNLETLAAGRPLVTTALGAEGLAGTPDEHYLVANHAGEFARAVVRVLRDKMLGEQLSKRGRSMVAACHDIPVVGARLDRTLRAMVASE